MQICNIEVEFHAKCQRTMRCTELPRRHMPPLLVGLNAAIEFPSTAICEPIKYKNRLCAKLDWMTTDLTMSSK
jgi:hypothetical protein